MENGIVGSLVSSQRTSMNRELQDNYYKHYDVYSQKPSTSFAEELLYLSFNKSFPRFNLSWKAGAHTPYDFHFSNEDEEALVELRGIRSYVRESRAGQVEMHGARLGQYSDSLEEMIQGYNENRVNSLDLFIGYVTTKKETTTQIQFYQIDLPSLLLPSASKWKTVVGQKGKTHFLFSGQGKKIKIIPSLSHEVWYYLSDISVFKPEPLWKITVDHTKKS